MEITYNHDKLLFEASGYGQTFTGDSVWLAMLAARTALGPPGAELWADLMEAYKIKVNFKGRKTRKLKCPKGMKVNASRTACVPMTGGEKATQRVAKRKMVRTVKSKGATFQRRKLIKSKRALRFRKMYHI